MERFELNEFKNSAKKFYKKYEKELSGEKRDKSILEKKVLPESEESGFTKMLLSEDSGGFGMDRIFAVAFFEELGMYSPDLAAILIFQNVLNELLTISGNNPEENFSPFHVPKLSGGNVDNDLNIKKTAKGFVLDGILREVVNFFPSGKNLYFWLNIEGKNRLIKVPLKRAGIKVGKEIHTLGLDFLPVFSIRFMRAKITEKDFVGDKVLDRYFEILSYLLSSVMVGIMGGSVEYAAEYMKERYQGGKIIINHTYLRSILGEMKSRFLSAKNMLYSFELESELSVDNVAAIKSKIGRDVFFVTANGIQLLGGYGYMSDYPQEKRYRDGVTLSLIPSSVYRDELKLTEMYLEVL